MKNSIFIMLLGAAFLGTTGCSNNSNKSETEQTEDDQTNKGKAPHDHDGEEDFHHMGEELDKDSVHHRKGGLDSHPDHHSGDGHRH